MQLSLKISILANMFFRWHLPITTFPKKQKEHHSISNWLKLWWVSHFGNEFHIK